MENYFVELNKINVNGKTVYCSNFKSLADAEAAVLDHDQ